MLARAFNSLLLVISLFAFAQRGQAERMACATDDGLIWVNVRVEGRPEPLHFLLDSGAGSSVIDVACARRLGVKLGRRESVQGVGGEAVAYRVNGFRGALGSAALPSSMLAVDLSGLGCSRHLDGLLGLDFLREHAVHIDYGSREVSVLAPGGSPRVGEVLPLVRRNDAICVRIRVNGEPGLFRVDTGCSSDLQVVRRTGAAGTKTKSSIAVSTDRPEYAPATVQLGTCSLANVKAGVHSTAIFRGEDGLLGNGLLSRFTVTIDAARNCLVLGKR